MPRTRYRWDEESQKLVEVGSDWAPTARVEIDVDRHYENLAMQDGVVVGSRRQHREYLKSRNLALADDFKETWAKQQKQREAARQGDFDHKARREALGRALYQMEKP
jgi:hypothetical protein